ncbi:MAG: 5'-methylthioadenosine/S-adenosylhomocysteine nucleosidase [Dehalococcoidia bacterium]|nr:5'-methylthioadenosine/S-adenosylhomocysteine nucleosidase [Dehalococcoidia bacterium]
MQKRGTLLAVVTALSEEVEGVLKAGRFRRVRPEVWRGNLAGMPCVAAVLGIGKVRAAGRTQFVLDNYRPSIVLHIGTAGATSPDLMAGDMVVGRRLAQHDFTISDSSRDRLSYPVWLETSEHLLNLALTSARNVSLPRLRLGQIVTGDRPIMDPAERDALRNNFNADCVDMESAAVAEICALHGVPCLVVRAVSDSCNANTRQEFRSNIASISQSLAVLASAVAANLAGQTGVATDLSAPEKTRTRGKAPRKH